MAIGYFLRVGDQTTCGGRILTGDDTFIWYDAAAAREGDLVSCGKNPRVTYRIIGGTDGFFDEGQRLAGTLSSISSCPCRARFIHSIPDCYEEETAQSTYSTGFDTEVPEPAISIPKIRQPPEPEQHAQVAKKKTGVDAGFAVIPCGGTTEAWQRLLFTGTPPSGVLALFATLNGAEQRYKAGSIMLLVDPENHDEEQIAHMQAAKQRIDTALEPLTHKEANFLHQHYATIANFSSIADKGIGLAADSAGKYFANIEKILNEIQQTYKNAWITKGALIGEQFYVRRGQLFKELESVLKVGFLNKAMKLGEYTKIKNALGLSTRSITYQWNQTGINDIDGYATHIERAAKYVKAMRYTGYMGIGFSAVHSINEINKACSIGREDECVKKKYTEVGRFTGGLAGGYAGGALGMGLCTLILGGATIKAGGAGALACGVILGTGGGYFIGNKASDLGEVFGESIYETTGD